MQVIYIANTSQIDVLDVRTAADNQLVSGATGTYSIEDLAGNVVVSPLPLTEVAAGHYRGIVPHDAGLSEGRYEAVVSLTDTGGSVGAWRTPLQAEVRT